MARNIIYIKGKREDETRFRAFQTWRQYNIKDVTSKEEINAAIRFCGEHVGDFYHYYDVKADKCDDCNWREREQIRLDSTQFIKLPRKWEEVIDAWDEYRAHINPDDGTKINFYASEEHGRADRLTTMKGGKFLKKFAPHLTDEKIKQLANMLTGNQHRLTITMDQDTIVQVYRYGPTSCMAGSKFDGLDHHPAEVYGGKADLGLAFLGDSENATARCVIWPEKKEYGRIYGDDVRLRVALEKEGYYENEKGFSGAKINLLCKDHSDGAIRLFAPYVDNMPWACIQGEFLVLGRDKDGKKHVTLQDQSGYYNTDLVRCAKSKQIMAVSETIYVRDKQEYWSEEFDSWRDFQGYYWSSETESVEVGGQLVRADQRYRYVKVSDFSGKEFLGSGYEYRDRNYKRKICAPGELDQLYHDRETYMYFDSTMSAARHLVRTRRLIRAREIADREARQSAVYLNTIKDSPARNRAREIMCQPVPATYEDRVRQLTEVGINCTCGTCVAYWAERNYKWFTTQSVVEPNSPIFDALIQMKAEQEQAKLAYEASLQQAQGRAQGSGWTPVPGGYYRDLVISPAEAYNTGYDDGDF